MVVGPMTSEARPRVFVTRRISQEGLDRIAAQTDAYMHAEILSWSRSKGLFAGISLDGATLRNDLDENQILYGQRHTAQALAELLQITGKRVWVR